MEKSISSLSMDFASHSQFYLELRSMYRQEVNFQPLGGSGDGTHSSGFKGHRKVNVGVLGIAGTPDYIFFLP